MPYSLARRPANPHPKLSESIPRLIPLTGLGIHAAQPLMLCNKGSITLNIPTYTFPTCLRFWEVFLALAARGSDLDSHRATTRQSDM